MTDQADLRDTEQCREEYFAKMEAKTGRDIKIGVDVMDVVKAP